MGFVSSFRVSVHTFTKVKVIWATQACLPLSSPSRVTPSKMVSPTLIGTIILVQTRENSPTNHWLGFFLFTPAHFWSTFGLKKVLRKNSFVLKTFSVFVRIGLTSRKWWMVVIVQPTLPVTDLTSPIVSSLFCGNAEYVAVEYHPLTYHGTKTDILSIVFLLWTISLLCNLMSVLVPLPLERPCFAIGNNDLVPNCPLSPFGLVHLCLILLMEDALLDIIITKNSNCFHPEFHLITFSSDWCLISVGCKMYSQSAH